MFYKLYKLVCNTIHHLLECMESAFKETVFILNPWLTVGHGMTMKTKSPYIQVSDVLCYKQIPIMDDLYWGRRGWEWLIGGELHRKGTAEGRS